MTHCHLPLVDGLEQRRLLSGAFDYAFTFGQEDAFDSGNAVAYDAAGNYYVAGTFRRRIDVDPRKSRKFILKSKGDYTDIFLAKYNPAGRLIWARRYGGASDDAAIALAVGPTGDAYLAGIYEGRPDFGIGRRNLELISHGGIDTFVARVNGGGQVVWAGHVGGRRDDFVNTLAVDSSGNVFLGGTIRMQGYVDPSGQDKQFIVAGGVDSSYVSRLDGDTGQLSWIRHYGEDDTYESVRGLAPDDAGGVYVAGIFNREVRFDRANPAFNLEADDRDIYLGHLDDSGNWDWLRAMGGQGEQDVVGLVRGPSGDLFMAGNFDGDIDFNPGGAPQRRTGSGDTNVFVARADDDGGAVAWSRAIPATDGSILVRGIALDGNGDVYLAGPFEGTVNFGKIGGKKAVFETDKDEGRRVEPILGQPPFGLNFRDTADGWVLKLNAGGKSVYAKRFGGDDGGIEPRGIAADGDGNVVVTGAFTETVDLDPGKGLFKRKADDDADYAFVLRLRA